jgi:hypothetical protein
MFLYYISFASVLLLLHTSVKVGISPEEIRPPFKAFGFDIGKTPAELLKIGMKWSHNGVLPEYFTLVSGFFTFNEIPLIINYKH